MPRMAKSKAKPTKTTKVKTAVKRVAAKAKPQARSQKKVQDVAKTINGKLGVVTPYLAVGDASAALDWYKKVFGAKEWDRMPGPNGKIMHSTIEIGDSMLFVSDIFPQSDMVDPSRAGASVNLHYYRKDADKVWDRALANGAKVTMPFADQFWGDQYGKVLDPFGHSWAISRQSKLSEKELNKLREQAMAQMGAGTM